MSPYEHVESEPVALPVRSRRLRRGIYLLPSLLTVGNLLCGYFAILATFRGSMPDLDNAAKAIGYAILLDALDGFVARATHTNTEFGKEFDSLADVISFGIAPAFLAFAWGVRGIQENWFSHAAQIYPLGWLVTFAFVICCAWRLARFNIHGMVPSGAARYFVGVPTPAAAGFIAATVHAFKSPVQDWRLSLVWLALVLGLALLMVSRIRYLSFKQSGWRQRHPSLVIVLIAVLSGAVLFYSEPALLFIAVAYLFAGLAGAVVRLVRRHRLASRPA